MTITDNAENNGLQIALQQARSRLTRQSQAVKATIELIKMLEDALKPKANTK